MPTELVLLGPRRVGFRDYEERPLRAGEVRLKSLLSGISHGTEMSHYRGTAPFYRKRWDPQLRMFVEGGGVTAYPTTSGYENVSVVIERGGGVKAIEVGDRVWAARPHRETNIAAEDDLRSGRLALLPDEVSDEEGVFTSLARTALNAVHDARVKVGDNVAVFGLGAIGLMAVQLAMLSGARKVFAVDLIERRLKKADGYGAVALDARGVDAPAEIKRGTGGKGVDAAIEASGSYRGLHEAIRCCHASGRVVAVGFYQGGGSDLYLGEEWHHNRITMLSSMSFWDCPHRDYPMWGPERLIATVMELFGEKRLLVADLITHKIPFKEAQRAYELVDRRAEEAIKVALTYPR